MEHFNELWLLDLYMEKEKLVVKSTEAFEKLREVSKLAVPDEESEHLKKWRYLYLPIISEEGAETAIPYTLYYRGDLNLFVLVPEVDPYPSFEVMPGNENEYAELIEAMVEFTKKLEDPEKIVIPRLRPGKILAKHELENPLDDEKATELLKRYREHERLVKSGKLRLEKLTLRKYLETAYLCYRAVFRDVPADIFEAYERFSDFRRAGILELPPDDEEAFRRWLKSHDRGAHPFEIIAGWSRIGIVLKPAGDYFALLAGDIELYAKTYIRCVEALIDAKIPFLAPQLEEALKFATGNYWLEVNRIDGIAYEDIENKEKIVWQKLKLPNWKNLKVQD